MTKQHVKPAHRSGFHAARGRRDRRGTCLLDLVQADSVDVRADFISADGPAALVAVVASVVSDVVASAAFGGVEDGVNG
jgi:hypothetical protein